MDSRCAVLVTFTPVLCMSSFTLPSYLGAFPGCQSTEKCDLKVYVGFLS